MNMNSIDQHSSRIIKFINNGIIIDTKVLVTLIVGSYDILNSTNFLKEFHILPEDFNYLNAFFSNYKIRKLIISPYTFTETINWIEKLKSVSKQVLNQIIPEIIKPKENSKFCLDFEDVCVNIKDIILNKNFAIYGIDVALEIIAEEKSKCGNISMLSHDGRFLSTIKSNNILVINFNELKYNLF